MNIACNEDSCLDVNIEWLNDDQLKLNVRFNKDDVPDVNIDYLLSMDEASQLEQLLHAVILTKIKELEDK